MDEEHPTVPEAVDRPLIAVEVVATKTEDEAVLTVVVVAVATTAVDVVVLPEYVEFRLLGEN